MNLLFWDTESTDLSANWGRILTSSYVRLTGDPWTHRIDKRPWKGKSIIDDHKLVVAIRNEIEQADILCTWNGILHDVPLLNARLIKHGERETHLRSHLDMMYYAGGQSMKIGSRKLANVGDFFDLEDTKTPLKGEIWQAAATGDKKAMQYVADHGQIDVLVLRDLWPKMAPLVKKFQAPLAAWWKYVEDIPAEFLGKR